MTNPDIDARAFWLELPPFAITMREAVRLSDYSVSYPTGVTIGKTWRRQNGAFDHGFKANGGQPRWIICRYEEDDGDSKMAKIARYRPVIRVPMRRHDWKDWMPCKNCTDAMDCGSWASCEAGLSEEQKREQAGYYPAVQWSPPADSTHMLLDGVHYVKNGNEWVLA